MSETLPSDAELLAAWGGGDQEAGRTLVQRHFAMVCRFFQSKLFEDVEDLVHQTFMAALAQADRFRAEGSVRGYLLGIARRQLWNRFRKDRREAVALAKQDLSIEQLQGTPSAALQARDERTLLLQSLRRIPLDSQIVIELHYWEGLSMVEIGEVLEIPAGTVKSRLSTARAQLRERIARADVERELVASTLQDLDGWAADVRELVTRQDP
jgi:RNA polymerase sigma-70 factor (ECF subfamily)